MVVELVVCNSCLIYLFVPFRKEMGEFAVLAYINLSANYPDSSEGSLEKLSFVIISKYHKTVFC